jgi:hypothetical protein
LSSKTVILIEQESTYASRPSWNLMTFLSILKGSKMEYKMAAEEEYLNLLKEKFETL